MQFSVLGSGSRGNATVVTNGETHLLVDAGFSRAETRRRLDLCGLATRDLAAIVLTHEHGDHVRGAGALARADDIPLWMTAGTRGGMGRILRGGEAVRDFRPGHEFRVGGLTVRPFATLHDAAEPVAAVVEDPATGLRLGIATDLGRSTAQSRHFLQGCHGLVVEANYDERLLWTQAPYPAAVKNRIASSHGHLSNQAAAGLLRELWTPRLRAVVLAHVSEEANTPSCAVDAVTAPLRRRGFAGVLHVASANQPTPLLDLRVARAPRGSPQPSLFRRPTRMRGAGRQIPPH